MFVCLFVYASVSFIGAAATNVFSNCYTIAGARQVAIKLHWASSLSFIGKLKCEVGLVAAIVRLLDYVKFDCMPLEQELAPLCGWGCRHRRLTLMDPFVVWCMLVAPLCGWGCAHPHPTLMAHLEVRYRLGHSLVLCGSIALISTGRLGHARQHMVGCSFFVCLFCLSASTIQQQAMELVEAVP